MLSVFSWLSVFFNFFGLKCYSSYSNFWWLFLRTSMVHCKRAQYSYEVVWFQLLWSLTHTHFWDVENKLQFSEAREYTVLSEFKLNEILLFTIVFKVSFNYIYLLIILFKVYNMMNCCIYLVKLLL